SEKRWLEYRRVRKRKWQTLHLPAWLGRLLWPLYGIFIFLPRAKTVEFLLGFLTLATIAAMFFRARQLRARLYHAVDLAVFDFLPVPDEAIFRRQWWKFAFQSLWSILDFGILY